MIKTNMSFSLTWSAPMQIPWNFTWDESSMPIGFLVLKNGNRVGVLSIPWIQLKTNESLISRLNLPQKCTSQFENLTGALFFTVGNLTQNEARPVGHLTFASVDTLVRVASKKDFVILSPFRICAAFTGYCSYIHSFVGTFKSLWKRP